MSGYALPTDTARQTQVLAARRAAAEQSKSTWFEWLATAMRVVATRRHLPEMDDRMLKDIGISRSDALVEAGRAPWDFGPKAQ